MPESRDGIASIIAGGSDASRRPNDDVATMSGRMQRHIHTLILDDDEEDENDGRSPREIAQGGRTGFPSTGIGLLRTGSRRKTSPPPRRRLYARRRGDSCVNSPPPARRDVVVIGINFAKGYL